MAVFRYYSFMILNYTGRGAWILAATVVAVGIWVWGGYYVAGSMWFEEVIPFLYRNGPQSLASTGSIFICIIGIILANIKGKSKDSTPSDVGSPVGTTYSVFSSTSETPVFLRPLGCAIFISVVVFIFLALILGGVPLQSFAPIWTIALIGSAVFFTGHLKLYKGPSPGVGSHRFTFHTVSLFYGPLVILVLIGVGLGFLVSWGKSPYEACVSIFYVGYLFILGMSIVPRSAEKAGISPFDLPCPRITYALSKLGAMLLYTTIISGSMYILVIAFMWGSACLNKGC